MATAVFIGFQFILSLEVVLTMGSVVLSCLLMLVAIEFFFKFVVALGFRILEYNKGVVAALTAIVTVVLGTVDLFLRANTLNGNPVFSDRFKMLLVAVACFSLIATMLVCEHLRHQGSYRRLSPAVQLISFLLLPILLTYALTGDLHVFRPLLPLGIYVAILLGVAFIGQRLLPTNPNERDSDP